MEMITNGFHKPLKMSDAKESQIVGLCHRHGVEERPVGRRRWREAAADKLPAKGCICSASQEGSLCTFINLSD